MLRSIARHFNETVFRGPEMEGGSDVGTGGTTGGGPPLDGGQHSDAGGDPPDRGGSDSDHQDDKTLTVREQIKKSIAEASQDDADKPKRGETKKAAAAKAGEAPAPGVQVPVADANAIPAPEALSKEAKEAWKDVPPAVQQAFVKREQDMQRGVDELKNRYALIDQAIAPHQDALRQMNATPQQAVDRMFLWFKALAANPAEAYPQLAQSMGMDWKKLVSHFAGKGGQQQPGQQQQPQLDANGQPIPAAPEIPEPVRNYVGQLEAHIRNLTNQMQQGFQQMGGRVESFEQAQQRENMNRTNENLSQWAKDKPYFEEVRQEMASLLQSGLIPLKDGNVDLDTAYERAIHFKPEVRAKVLSAQQEANRAVQTQTAQAATTAVAAKTGQARKAASSLPANNPPGTTVQGIAQRKKPGQKMSVRDSINEAMGQLRDQ